MPERAFSLGCGHRDRGDRPTTKLGQKENPKTQSAVQKINKLRWAALVTRAQLFGFRSNSIDKDFDTLIVQVDI